jgi:nitroreductase / dihydropteridine reductase
VATVDLHGEAPDWVETSPPPSIMKGKSDTAMDLENLMHKHLTRAFDSTRIIPEVTLERLLKFLRSVPSSVNVQPNHFYVLGTRGAKERLARNLGAFSAGNGPKVLSASHVIIFTTRANLPDSHIEEVFAKEVADGRFPDPQNNAMWEDMVRSFYDLRYYDYKDMVHWLEKQTYLALGLTMMAAAELGVDATPLEGFDPHAVDMEFKIRETGYTTTVLLALGYPDTDQVNKSVTSRLDPSRLFTFA